MQVTLTAAESKFVRKEIECGAYPNERAVIRESLRLFKEREEEKRRRFDAFIQKGVDSIKAGRSVPLSEFPAALNRAKAALRAARS